ncbi:MAG: hypothetical protein H0X17_22875 [Deltaproteobacteria bacterium]|nr:hypothetical protein [Deltaproteobacteria bacterium]
MPPQYKFVELTPVTDETIEECVNEWIGQGWQLEGIRFVTTEHSKRPSMAFVSFTREATQQQADGEPPRKPRPLVKPEGVDKPEAPPGEPAVIVAAHGSDVD